MSGHTVILRGDVQRQLAKAIVDAAPVDAVVTVKTAARSADQNAKMWAMLSDISRARPEGRTMPPDLWKCAFMSAIGHELQRMDGIDGNPPFYADYRSSRLGKTEMSDLITFMQEYGDRHGVRWSEPAREDV
jgi:hypothetical protein